MSFVNKEIELTDFLKKLRQRIESASDSSILVLFDTTLPEELAEAVKEHTTGWSGRSNAGDFDHIYPLAVNILRETAGRMFSEVHSGIYKEAHAISVAFCDELNEMFQCSGADKFDLIPIKSFVDMAVEADTVRVEDDSVQLTPKGEEMARETEAEIQSMKN